MIKEDELFEVDRKINLIVKLTCVYFGLKEKDVFSMTRKTDYKNPRQIIQYLISKHTKKSLNSIGGVSLYYGRPRAHTHASVLNSINVVKDLLETDKDFLQNVQKIEFNLIDGLKDLTEEEIDKLSLFNKNQKLQERLLIKNNEIIDIKNELKTAKENIISNSKNIYLKHLLTLDDDVIDFFISTRLEPFLKMNKLTNRKSA